MNDMVHKFQDTEAVDTEAPSRETCLNSAIDLVSAYVSNNSLDSSKLVDLLKDVNSFIKGEVLGSTAAPQGAVAEVVSQREPAPEKAPPAPAPRAKAATTASTVQEAAPDPEPKSESINLRPAVPVKESVPQHGEYIICLEDGKQLKTLKRHLAAKFNMTPEDYRKRWDLPPDYPMVARAYSESRSGLAKRTGFGKRPAK